MQREDNNDEGEESEESRSEEEAGREEEEEVASLRMHSFSLSGTSRLARAVGLIMLLASSTAAQAVSITNRDDHEHRVTIIEGDSRADHVLQPSQTLTGVCEKGCTIRLDEDEEDDWYQLETGAVVSIEDGILYFDSDSPASPAPPPASGGLPGGKG